MKKMIELSDHIERMTKLHQTNMRLVDLKQNEVNQLTEAFIKQGKEKDTEIGWLRIGCGILAVVAVVGWLI